MTEQAADNGHDAGAVLEELSQRLIAEHWDFYPTAGSRIGRHEYDGRLPDLAPSRISPAPPGNQARTVRGSRLGP